MVFERFLLNCDFASYFQKLKSAVSLKYNGFFKRTFNISNEFQNEFENFCDKFWHSAGIRFSNRIPDSDWNCDVY